MNIDKFTRILKDNNYTMQIKNHNDESDLWITKDRNIIRLPLKRINGYAYGNPIYSELKNVENLQQLFQSIEYIARSNEKAIDEFLNLLIEEREEYL